MTWDLEVEADAEALELLAELEVQLGRHHVDLVQLVERRRPVPDAPSGPTPPPPPPPRELEAMGEAGAGGRKEEGVPFLFLFLLGLIWAAERRWAAARRGGAAPPGRNLEMSGAFLQIAPSLLQLMHTRPKCICGLFSYYCIFFYY